MNTIPSIIAQMPMMTEAQNTLNNYIIFISSFGSSQSINRKGIVKDKEDLRDLLTRSGLDLARKVVAYGTNVGNMVLLEDIRYTK